MPNYDSITQSDKLAVVFDIGNVYTKCGFAGESYPRFIVPTPPEIYDKTISKKEISNNIFQFLHKMYYDLLLVSPKDRPVVIVDSILSNPKFNDLLAEVFFINFLVPSILFTPNHVISLMTLGISTALVLDCGYAEAVILPVFSGQTILKAWELAPLAFRAILKNMHELIRKHCNILDAENVIGALKDNSEVVITDKMVEDIIVKTCFVSSHHRANEWKEWREKTEDGVDNSEVVKMPKCAEVAFKYPLNAVNKCYFLQIPSWIREAGPEVLFTGDRDNITLQTLILRSIKGSPIDTRKSLAENILINGGTSFIPGLRSRLKEELIATIETNPEFKCLEGIKDSFKFHNPPSKPNYTCWLGAAMFGSLEILASRSIDNAMFLQNPHISDWSNTHDPNQKPEKNEDQSNESGSLLGSNLFAREDIKSTLRSSRLLFAKNII